MLKKSCVKVLDNVKSPERHVQRLPTLTRRPLESTDSRPSNVDSNVVAT